ncbi:MAG: BatA and WFA domain-containing protein [Planctomycetota bacterium]
MNPFPALLLPAHLYLFLGIPLLFLIFFQTKRYQFFSVPHLKLLQEILKENRWYYASHQYLKWIQFFLWLLILICLTLSASFPAGGRKEWKKRYFQAIIDLSPSGMVQESGKLRYEILQEKLRDFILLLKPEDYLMLITVGKEISLLAPYTTNRKLLLEKVSQLKPQAFPVSLSSAFDLVEKIKVLGSHTFLFSDGASKRSSLCKESQAIFISCGDSEVNLALQKVAFESLYDQDVLLVQVYNDSTEPQIFRLRLTQNQNPIYLATFQIEAESHLTKTVPIRSLDFSSPVRIQIENPQDAFPWDNETTLLLPLKPRLVALSSLELLEPIFQLFQTRFRVKESVQIAPEQIESIWKAGDLILMDGGHFPSLPRQGFYVFFGTTGLSDTISSQVFKDLEAWQWDATHPIHHYCSYEWLYIQEAKEFHFPEGQTLIRSRTGEVLCSLLNSEQAHILYFPFELKDSNLVTLAVFPLLFANILDWAGHQKEIFSQNFCYPEPISFPQFPQILLTDPATHFQKVLHSGESLSGLWPGVYTIEIPEKRSFPIVYHPFSPEFSQIRPTPGITPRWGLWLDKESPDYREYWKPLIYLALLLLGIELLLYGIQEILRSPRFF